MTAEDERFCLEELARGNKLAFEWLFLTWHPRLVNFFTRLIEDGDMAYDYAQDVFYDIWSQRRKFSDVKSFSAYLFQMARFKVYNHFDKVAVKSRFKGEMVAGDSASTPTKESAMFASEMESAIWETVRQLPSKRRKVFIMSRMQGFSNEEIARELGISKRTVENHITSTLADLRKVVK
jgi:RNA polymerase sigma-70 factor (ECF subfamily)